VDEALNRHILELERLLLNPEVRQSAQKISELLSDDFAEFTSSGTIYRYNCGDIFIVPAQGEIVDFSLRELSEDCVLATYRFTRSDGTASLRSSVWRRACGQWKMAFHQGTPERPG
jgi:hypothetical protein